MNGRCVLGCITVPTGNRKIRDAVSTTTRQCHDMIEIDVGCRNGLLAVVANHRRLCFHCLHPLQNLPRIYFRRHFPRSTPVVSRQKFRKIAVLILPILCTLFFFAILRPQPAPRRTLLIQRLAVEVVTLPITLTHYIPMPRAFGARVDFRFFWIAMTPRFCRLSQLDPVGLLIPFSSD